MVLEGRPQLTLFVTDFFSLGFSLVSLPAAVMSLMGFPSPTSFGFLKPVSIFAEIFFFAGLEVLLVSDANGF